MLSINGLVTSLPHKYAQLHAHTSTRPPTPIHTQPHPHNPPGSLDSGRAAGHPAANKQNNNKTEISGARTSNIRKLQKATLNRQAKKNPRTTLSTFIINPCLY